LIATLIFISCKTETKKKVVEEVIFDQGHYHSMEQLSWLEGDWSNITEKSQSYESWKQLNDSTLVSLSYTMVKGDTVFEETMKLQENRKGVFMTINVPDQNEAESVTFQLISSEDGIFTFENKNHDFPQRISYSNPMQDSIHAWIEGIVEGEDRKIDFLYKRSNY